MGEKRVSNCNNCKYFHGAHGIVCGVHPSGPEDRHCLDYAGISKRERFWRKTKLLRHFFWGIGLSEMVLSACLVAASCFWVVARVLMSLPVSLPGFAQALPSIVFTIGHIYLTFSKVFLVFEVFKVIDPKAETNKIAIASLSGFTVGALFWMKLFSFG
jgi:hypothetical protein